MRFTATNANFPTAYLAYFFKFTRLSFVETGDTTKITGSALYPTKRLFKFLSTIITNNEHLNSFIVAG